MKKAFKIYILNNHGFITNRDLFHTLKKLVGNNLTDIQMQQRVDRVLLAANKDQDGRISFDEFCNYCKENKKFLSFKNKTNK